MPVWWEMAQETHEAEASPEPLTECDLKALRLAKRDLRILKPHYWAVFKSFLEHGEVGWVQGQPIPTAYHGFYVDMGRRLGVSPNTVKYRLQRSVQWFIKRVRYHADQEEKRA